jgi:hypothetical protein
MTRNPFRLVSAVLLAVGVMFGAGGVATAAPDAQPVNTQKVTQAAAPGEAGVLSFQSTCFGYTGTFKDGSIVLLVDWQTTRDECFGIAPNRTIWHTWAGSGGWVQMPGNGHADDTGTTFLESAAGSRIVSVWVNGSGEWCQNFARATGWAGTWYKC